VPLGNRGKGGSRPGLVAPPQGAVRNPTATLDEVGRVGLGTGSIRAGCRAGFVARSGMVLDPTGETPDVIGDDLGEVADRLLGG
jgi:hypothetical protein